jgi:hypothetical protein
MSDELRDEYEFDYRQAKPNPFAGPPPAVLGEYIAERGELFSGRTLEQLAADIRRSIRREPGSDEPSR